jgi:hypothetical protein
MYAAHCVDPQTFFASKPADTSNHDWLFSAANPARLPGWFNRIIDLIQRRAVNAPRQQTFFYQEYLIEEIGKGERTIRYGLRLLEKLGVIATHRDRQNRHKIVAEFFDPPEPPRAAPPPTPPPAQMLIKVAGEVAGEKTSYKDEDKLRRNNNIIRTREQAQGDDKDQQAIINTFEQMTGSQYQPGRDGSTLQALRGQYDLATIIMGVMLSALRLAMAQPGAQIRSLAYCRAAIIEVAAAKIKDQTGYFNYLKRKARQILGINLL